MWTSEVASTGVNSIVEFEWDPLKAAANVKKHGVGFAEAMTVFSDPLEITISDPDHSVRELRFLSIGTSTAQRLIVIAYTETSGSNANHQRA